MSGKTTQVCSSRSNQGTWCHEPTRSCEMSHTLVPATGNEAIQALTEGRDKLQGKVKTLL